MQNLVFVWGSSGPSAAAESSAKPVPAIPDLEQTEGQPQHTSEGDRITQFLPVSPRLIRLLIGKSMKLRTHAKADMQRVWSSLQTYVRQMWYGW
jgi:hypothetical protein